MTNRKYTNMHDIPLPMAVFLAEDKYDHNADPMTISATSLLKPAKAIILARRVPQTEENLTDISTLAASKIGTAIHDSIEAAWRNNYVQSLIDLGVNKRVANKVRIDPEPSSLEDDDIPVYLELRTDKKVGDWTVSGKFDMVFDGKVIDFKSTGTYTYMSGNKDDDYIMQGSIYKWLNPDLITEDVIGINFLFKDWSPGQYRIQKEKGYPIIPAIEKDYPLERPAVVEAWVKRKLITLTDLMDAPEELLPDCTDKELGRSETVWKYYAKQETADANGRATKNFTNYHDAQLHLINKGNKGVVKEVKGGVWTCNYCNAAPVCQQRQQLLASGDLK